MTEQTIPEGYMKNAQGNLVPLGNIKPYDLARDKLINALMIEAEQQQGKLASFRDSAMQQIDKLIKRAHKEFKTDVGGAKGNISLVSYDAQLKVQVSVSDDIYFDERIQVARKLINECLDDWMTTGTNQNLRVVIDAAFQVNADGGLSTSRILGLKKLKITDTKWKRAMRALNDSIQVAARKPYLRFYKKNESGEWINMPLDIAKLSESIPTKEVA